MKILILLLLLVCGSGASAQQQAPVMFRGDAAHTGTYAGGGPQILGMQWRFRTMGDVISSPAVANGTVYFGSADGTFYAVQREAGTLVWKFDAHSPISSSPAIADGIVFFGSRDGSFYALDARSGRVRWRVTSGPSVAFPWGHESGDHWTSSPVYHRGAVLIGGGDGVLYKLDAATGRTLWRARTGGRIRGSAAASDNMVYIGSFDGRLYSFDESTGREKWHYDTEGASLRSSDFGFDRRSLQASPSVAGGSVFIGGRDGFLYAIDAATGKLRWRYDHKISWVNSSPAVSDGVVYAGSSDGHFLQAVDAGSGKELWEAKSNGIVWTSPALTREYVYWGEGDGTVHVSDRASGRDVSTFATGSQVYSSPFVDRDLVFTGSSDGGLYALRIGSDHDAVQRAVFYDSTYVRISMIRNSAAVSNYLSARSYKVLDAGTVVQFMQDRISDRRASVLVFAIDAVPDAAASKPYANSIFRRYLDSGGKIVWLGIPPLIWPVEPLHGERTGLNELVWNAPEDLLGVSFKGGIFDLKGARSTALGQRWGLPLQWRSAWGIDPIGISVLASDDWGLASAWSKQYAGPRGTGFVVVPSDNLLSVYLVAEYRPLGPVPH